MREDLRPWLAVALALAAAFAWGTAALHLWLDGDRAAGWISGKLTDATGRSVRVDVVGAEASLLRRSLRLRGVTVDLGPARGEGGVPAEEGGDKRPVRLAAAEVQVSGVSPWSLLTGGGLWARELTVRAPSVLAYSPGGEDDAAPAGRSDDGVQGRMLRMAPGSRFDRVEVDDGTILLVRRGHRSGEGTAHARLVEGLSLRLEEMSVDSAAASDGDRVLFSRDGRMTVRRFRRWRPDPPYLLEITDMEASTSPDSLRLGEVSLQPHPDASAWRRAVTHRRTRFDVSIAGITASGVDHHRLAEGTGIVARRIDVERLEVLAHADRRLPEDPGSRPPRMPVEQLAAAAGTGWSVAVDTARIADGRIVYSERVPDAPRAGRVVFEELGAVIAHVRDPATARESDGDGDAPALSVRAEARLYGAAPIGLDLRMPLTSEGFDFSAEGTVGALQLGVLSEMFTPVEGIRIERGSLDGLRFDLRVEDGHAGGSLRARYRELDLEKTGRDGGGGVLDFLANLFIGSRYHSRNPPEEGEEPRVGVVDYRRQPDDPFFGFLWRSVRSGVYSLMGT